MGKGTADNTRQVLTPTDLSAQTPGQNTSDASQSFEIPQPFTTSEPEAVSKFLEENPHVLSTLLESVVHLKSAFGSEVTPRLKLVVDPEQTDEVELFAVIPWAGAPEEARNRLATFDRSWWLDASGRAGFMLNFDIELQ